VNDSAESSRRRAKAKDGERKKGERKKGEPKKARRPPEPAPLIRAPLPEASAPAKASGHPQLWRGIGAAFATLTCLVAALVYPVLVHGRGWLSAEWHNGWVLSSLVIVPLVWWWGTFGQDRRKPRLRIGTTLPFRSGPRGWRVRLRDVPGILRAAAVALFIAALARPVAVLSDDTSEERGIDIVIAMDLSGSMRAILDASPNDLPSGFDIPKDRRLTRLDTAKIVVQDFIQRRKTDRIGVVVFGRDAFIVSPPTLDYQLLGKLVSRLGFGVIDDSVTAIGDAIGTAVARLRRNDALSKVVILLTDGDNNAGKISPDYAIELATAVGSKVYTIQIGDGAEVDVLEGHHRGVPIYKRARYPTNPELLKKIADKTGGQAFIATDAKALRDSMHTILDQLEKTRFEASVAHHEELFPLLLFPGVVLVGLEALLRALLLRRFP
jgi:Ca-activated chloride channel family protein